MLPACRITPALLNMRSKVMARLTCSVCIRSPTHSGTNTYAWTVLPQVNSMPACIANMHKPYDDLPLHEGLTCTVLSSKIVTRLCHNSCTDTSDSSGLHLKMTPSTDLIDASDDHTRSIMVKDMMVFENFISLEEEMLLYQEVQPYLKKLRYEYDHWDDAIHGYRETEKSQWSEKSDAILQKVRDLAFPPGTPQLAFVHVLDLAKEGQIKAHIDSVRFCGSTIAGLSLLSNSVMRLVHDKDKSSFADILLKKRSLYIMRNQARFEYTHEVLGDADSLFRGGRVPRDRRISVICRCEPADNHTQPDS